MCREGSVRRPQIKLLQIRFKTFEAGPFCATEVHAVYTSGTCMQVASPGKGYGLLEGRVHVHASPCTRFRVVALPAIYLTTTENIPQLPTLAFAQRTACTASIKSKETASWLFLLLIVFLRLSYTSSVASCSTQGCCLPEPGASDLSSSSSSSSTLAASQCVAAQDQPRFDAGQHRTAHMMVVSAAQLGAAASQHLAPQRRAARQQAAAMQRRRPPLRPHRQHSLQQQAPAAAANAARWQLSRRNARSSSANSSTSTELCDC